MKAISIRQPWAHLIIHGGKDIENRDWLTNLRGRILVHAAKGMTVYEYHEALEIADHILKPCFPASSLPDLKDLQRGGIIGSVELVDCVQSDGTESPWFFGRYGFVLRDPRPLPFIPFRGSLGFFDVPDHLVAA